MSASDERVSDAEREAAVQALREHAAAGRLSMDELSERTEEAYGATTVGELVRVSRDLPASPTVGPPLAAPERRISAVLGNQIRGGPWVVPEELELRATLGNLKLDLRETELPPRVTIRARALLGEIRLYVPAGVRVSMTGSSVLSDRKLRSEGRPPADGPQIDVEADSVLGTVIVDVQTPAERLRSWVGRFGG